jgi:LmbE family N-acetylglucosaminyl deacetylase
VLINNINKANFYVDISDYLETKLEAIKCHESQYDDFDGIKERMTKRAELLGEKIGVKYAEGFVKVSSQR